MIATTIKSGDLVIVAQTASAATITATLPMASFREHNHTERTLASPSLYLASSNTLGLFLIIVRRRMLA